MIHHGICLPLRYARTFPYGCTRLISKLFHPGTSGPADANIAVRERSSRRVGHVHVLGVGGTFAVVSGGRVDLGFGGEDGVLAARASPVKTLVTGGGVVEHGGDGDVVIGALTGLVIGAEAPGVAFAVAGDGEAVVGAGGDHGAGTDAGDLGGLEQDAGLAFGVDDDVVVGDGGVFDAGLAAVKAAPDEALAVFGGSDGVMGPSREVGDGVIDKIEVVDDGRGDDDRVVFASVVVNAGGAERVGAPGPNLIFAVDGE